MGARSYQHALKRQAGAGARLQAEIGRRIRERLNSDAREAWPPDQDVFWRGHCTIADPVRFELSREVLADLRRELEEGSPQPATTVTRLHPRTEE